MLPKDSAAASAWIAERLRREVDESWLELLPPRHVFQQVCPAAVLICLVWRPEGLSVLLTRRSDDLPTHPGQVSFPGGKEEGADRGPADTALREAWEEVGLAREQVSVLGSLPPLVTITRFSVVPVVGMAAAPLSLTPQPGEVAEIFEVPLAQVLRADAYQRHRYLREGGEESFYLSLAWGDYFIWGATAAMLRLLALMLTAPD